MTVTQYYSLKLKPSLFLLTILILAQLFKFLTWLFLLSLLWLFGSVLKQVSGLYNPDFLNANSSNLIQNQQNSEMLLNLTIFNLYSTDNISESNYYTTVDLVSSNLHSNIDLSP